MRALVLGILLLSNTAYAFEVTKPVGAPEAYIEEHGVTVAVFAVTSPVGSGIVVGEKKANGKFEVCGTCSRFVVDLGAEIAFKGGEIPYIEGMRPEINAILAQRYPPILEPLPGTTPLERLNYALFNSYRLVGGKLLPK